MATRYELFSVCRNCSRSTTFVVSQKHIEHKNFFEASSNLMTVKNSLNNYVDVEGYINLSDFAIASPPDYLPEDVLSAFNEGAKCFGIGSWNAAGSMFRTCIDLDAEDLLDFTTALLERIFTEPQRIRLAELRRKARRAKTS